jgi:hypothetical protein
MARIRRRLVGSPTPTKAAEEAYEAYRGNRSTVSGERPEANA